MVGSGELTRRKDWEQKLAKSRSNQKYMNVEEGAMNEPNNNSESRLFSVLSSPANPPPPLLPSPCLLSFPSPSRTQQRHPHCPHSPYRQQAPLLQLVFPLQSAHRPVAQCLSPQHPTLKQVVDLHLSHLSLDHHKTPGVPSRARLRQVTTGSASATNPTKWEEERALFPLFRIFDRMTTQ